MAMGLIQGFFDAIGNWTWGWSLIPFLVVLGCFFTIASGFVQFRWFGRMWGVLRGHQAGAEGHVSSREALLVSVGGRVGGGNIAGVAVAISLGGPGAVFWMWVIALVGMCTSLIECSLAQLYKRTDVAGTYRGGPAQYIIHGLGQNFRWLAVVYAICLIAAFALGFNAFQGNTVAGAMLQSFGIERLYTGVALAAVTGFIVYGGIKRIAKAADVIVPIMAVGYILLALLVIVLNITSLPGMIVTIVKSAFGYNEAIAGGIGAAIANGVRRGLFSNEAGLGSAPNVAAAAYVHHPVSQGIVQLLSVFIDTMIICSATAFMILLSDAYVPGADIDGVVLTQQALASELGGWSQYYLACAILLFAFSSIIYNYYLGENALSVFTESETWFHVLRIAVIGLVFLGCAAPRATSVFFFSDPMMGVLAIVNLLALAMLFPVAMRLIADYRRQLAAGIAHPVLDTTEWREFDIDPTAWTEGSEPAPPASTA
jgi:AGCS family alanine or glycine:cation symporter